MGIYESATKITNLIIGIIVAVMVAMILLGGVKRIGRVTERLIPFMALLYIVLAFGVIILILIVYRVCFILLLMGRSTRLL